jgi:uncharacterized membrane protein
VVNVYNLLKYLHVLSVIVWVGGLAGVALVTWRVARSRDNAVLSAVLRQSTAFGQYVVGPAAGIVLLTGLAMVWLGKIGFTTLWVLVGLTGIVLHGLIGGIFIRKRVLELTATAGGAGNDAALVATARRLWMTQLVYLLIFALVVAAMVVKPTM